MRAGWIVVIVAMLTASSVSAQEFKLKAGSVAPQGTPWHKIILRVKKRVEKKSEGRIKVKMYLGQALGGEKSIVKRCQNGSLALIGVSAGALATAVPELNAYEIPYLFNSFKQADKVLASTYSVASEIMAQKGFVLYMWSENGFRDFATTDKFIKRPGDLSGMKMRSQQSFVHTAMYKALGANPNPIAVPNVPESLGSGVVKGYDNTPLYSYAAQWYKYIKYVTLSHHIYQPAIIAYCKKWFDKLPGDLQAVLMLNAEKDTRKGLKAIRAMNEQIVGKMKKEGLQFYKPTAAERGAMKKATAGVQSKFRARTGASGSRLLDAILKAR
jgi:tripartite ATP-independent transporter DctP family solute receptor